MPGDPSEMDPQDAAGPPPETLEPNLSPDLLNQIIAATEQQQAGSRTPPLWDVEATDFKLLVRQQTAWQTDREIVWGMVAAALPLWVRRCLPTSDAGDEFVNEVALVLWNNLPQRDRIIALYHELRSPDGRAELNG